MSHPVYRRFLAVKFADLGDALCITPALRALRETFPDARIDVATTPRGAGAFAPAGAPGAPALVDGVLVFEKADYDRARDALRPDRLAAALGQIVTLRRRNYDALVLFHHLTLRFGALKHAAVALAGGRQVRAGLDNGRGWFLTHRVPDLGYGASHEVAYWLAVVAALGARTRDLRLVPPITDADRADAARWLPGGSAPWVAIHPGSGGYSPARRWDLDGFAVVAERLAGEMGARVVLVGTPADRVAELAARLPRETLSLEGRTTPGQLAAVLTRCRAFVGADSGVMHLAAAAGTAVVALFGPTNAAAWAPWQPGGRARVLRSAPACSPCMYVGHELGSRTGQPERTCMRMLAPDDVMRAVAEVWEPGPAPALSPLPVPPPLPARPRPVVLLGVPIDPVTYGDTLEYVAALVRARVPRQLATVNPEFLMAARRDAIFRYILRRAALRLPDGQGILWAAARRGCPLKERVTGVDLVERLAARAAREGWRVYFLGAGPGVAEEAATVLAHRYPGLIVAGTYAGSPSGDEEEALAARVRAARADILLVAYGAPAQDKWIARNLPRLGTPVCIGVGGAFDFIAGHVPRAPLAWQHRGLEWLWRLRHQPWRWRRMLALPAFVLRVALSGRETGEACE